MRTRYKIGLLTIVIAIMQFPTMGASASTAEFLGRVAGLLFGSGVVAVVIFYISASASRAFKKIKSWST